MTEKPDNFIADGIPVPTETAVWPFKADHTKSVSFPARNTPSLAEAMAYGWDSILLGDAASVSFLNRVDGTDQDTLCVLNSDGMVRIGDFKGQVLCHVSRWLHPDSIVVTVHKADDSKTTTTAGTSGWALNLITKALEDLNVTHVDTVLTNGKAFRATRFDPKKGPVTLGGLLRDDVARRVCGCIRLLGSRYNGHTDDSLLNTKHPFDLTCLDEDDWDNLELDLASEFNHDFNSLSGQCANVPALVDLVYSLVA